MHTGKLPDQNTCFLVSAHTPVENVFLSQHVLTTALDLILKSSKARWPYSSMVMGSPYMKVIVTVLIVLIHCEIMCLMRCHIHTPVSYHEHITALSYLFFLHAKIEIDDDLYGWSPGIP